MNSKSESMEKKRFDIANMVQLGWILIHAAYILIIILIIIHETFWGKALERLDHLSQILMLLAIVYAGHYAKKTYDTTQDELKLAKKAAKFERDLKLYEIFEAKFDALQAELKSLGEDGDLSLLWNHNKQEPVYELIGEWDNEARYGEISNHIMKLMIHIIRYKYDWKTDLDFRLLIMSKIWFIAIVRVRQWLDESAGFRKYVLADPELKDFFHFYLGHDFTKHN